MSNAPPTSELPLVHIIEDLERLKVLADPLRLRILEELCGEARTTKQVAKALGEPPTRLYHHVETLERAQLIRLERTRPVRGTVEKYYRSVARSFRADPRLFSLDGGAAQSALAAELLEGSAAELRALPQALDAAAAGEGVDSSRLADAIAEGMLIVNVSLKRLETTCIVELRRRLDALIEEMQGWGDDVKESAPHAPEHRLVIALYPLGVPRLDEANQEADQ
ncbi:MAG: winged helix-turn-helix domain-containing protein [Acidobacteriota bacterium]